MIRHLRTNGVVVLVLQPVQVKAFAKNDVIDAALIAARTAVLDPAELDVDTRLEHISGLRLRGVVTRDITRLKGRRAAELLKIVKAIRQYADLAARFDLIQSVPDIGERTALAILLRLPELGHVTREQAVALAGLAPYDQDSGRCSGQRHIAAGRTRLRHPLHAAALPAAFRWNPALKALYERLLARGKAHKVALAVDRNGNLVDAMLSAPRHEGGQGVLPLGEEDLGLPA